MSRIAILLIFSCVQCIGAAAQAPLQFFEAREYGNRQGLTVDETIYHLSTDDKGYLWISTGNGLFRFNGTQFKTFPVKKGVPYMLQHREARFFVQDNQGRYFTGVTGSGLYEYNDTTGHFIPFTLTDSIYNPANYMLGAPYIDDANNLWVSLESKGLMRINTRTRQYRFYDLKDPQRGYNYRSTSWVNKIIPSRSGGLWVGTNNGVLKLDTATGEKKHYSFVDKYPQLEHSAISLYEDEDGSLWLATWAHGLVHFFPSTGRMEHYFFYPGKVSNTENIFLSVFPKNERELWLGSYYGITIFNRQTHQFTLTADMDYEVNGQQVFGEKNKSKILDGYWLITDRHNQLWGCTNKTVTRLNMKDGFFPYTFVPFGTVPNKWAFGIWKVLQHPLRPSRFFCAAQFGNGLYLYDADTKKATVLPGGPPMPCEVSDIFLQGNRLWVCTSKGLFLYDMLQQQFIPLPYPELAAMTAGKYIFCITINNDGIWVSAGGLLHCDMQTGKTALFKNNAGRSLPQADVLALFSDKSGNTWAGLNNGLSVACIQKGSGGIVQYSGNKNIYGGNGESITQTKNGDIFFCNRLNGLYRIEHPLTPSERLTQYTKLDGLPGDRIYAAFADSDDFLWLNTSNGLSICNSKTMQFSNYDRQNGMPHEDIVSVCSEISPGRIILPLRYGFTVINRDSLLQQGAKTIPISIQKFTVNGKPYDENIAYFNHQVFNYYQNNFSIDFSALSYDDPAGIEYYYILKGLGKDTVHVTARTNITLYALPPGKYTLQIRLKERNKPMQAGGFDFYFTIRPPFWKTWWFIALCVFAGLLILYRFYRYRINQVIRLQQVRNTIAQDLHDDVGSTMTTISILSDVAKQKIDTRSAGESAALMDEIGTQSRGLLDKLDDIVWSVNPKNDSLQQMSFRMKQLAIDLLGNKGIKTDIRMPEQLDHVLLSMEKRRNFYLVYKEALHNISKYAGAKNVVVQVNRTGRQLVMNITDDGCGFDTNSGQPGNGLSNMQSRARQSGGSCTIRSTPGKGTTVTLSLPV